MSSNADCGPPYARVEFQGDLPRFPTRGLYCRKCRTYIPEFMDLTGADYHRIRTLALEGRSALAIAELVSATGCPERWAKIWVLHAGRPHVEVPGPPCPHCGQLLRTDRAKQCPHCFANWHEG